MLTLCIFSVLTAELFNSALETLARVVTRDRDETLGAALDIASAAVLITAAGAVIVGGIIFVPKLVALAG